MRLAAHSTYIPLGRKSVVQCVTASGASEAEGKAFGRLFGFDSVALSDDAEDLEAGFRRVLDGLMPGKKLPDTLLYVHGNPVQPGTLPWSHPVLGQIDDTFEMDQQNCSTLFWALDAARRLLADGSTGVLILAGDSMRGLPDKERYAPGCTAIGDAYAALLLDDAPGGLQIDDVYLDTRAEYHFGRFGSPDETGQFNAAHTTLVSQILSGLDCDADGHEPILPHNVNRLSWYKYAKDTGIDARRIWLDLLPEIGHCYTLDAMLMIDRWVKSDEASAAMLSVGQGGFLGGCRVSDDGGHHAAG